MQPLFITHYACTDVITSTCATKRKKKLNHFSTVFDHVVHLQNI